jgi:hypothetical protein
VVGFQTSPVRVSEDIPETASLATLDAFASSGSHQIPRYMTWEQDSRAMAINALDYYWDPVTRLFLWSLSFFLALEGALEQQIKVILICTGWEGAMWWPQLV